MTQEYSSPKKGNGKGKKNLRAFVANRNPGSSQNLAAVAASTAVRMFCFSSPIVLPPFQVGQPFLPFSGQQAFLVFGARGRHSEGSPGGGDARSDG